MKVQSAKFLLSALNYEMCPESSLPEFAMIGRSNVGKSSLINLLCNQDNLARVSQTPGRTREINFFLVNDNWNLIDLPGYGYAKVSKSERHKFNEFVTDYIIERPNLRGIFVLIDSRHPPQKIDLEFVQWLVENEVRFALIFTKTDKSKPKVVAKNITLFQNAMSEWSDGAPPIFTASIKNWKDRAPILNFIETAMQ